MQQQDSIAFLESLGHVIEPAAPEYSIPVGFLIFSAAGLLTFVLLFVSWRRRIQREAYRGEAICHLQAMRLQTKDSGQSRLMASETHRILKHVALQSYSRQQVASLNGEPWIKFLQSKTGNRILSQPSLDILASLSFLSKTFDSNVKDSEIEAFVEDAIIWIKTHKKDA